MSKRYDYRATNPLHSLAAAIRDSAADLIVPCDDRAVLHLHRLHAQAVAAGGSACPLPKLIERSLGAPGTFPVVSSRAAFLREALSQNIRVPKMAVISEPGDLCRWGATQQFPWVMKVDRSWGGLGVKIVGSLEEAESCFYRMSARLGTAAVLKRAIVNRDPFWIEPWWRWMKPAVTVQSHIEGSPANCTVFCWEGKLLAGIAVHVLAAQGLTGPATVVRIVDSEQMLGVAATLTKRLNLSGFHGFDFMIEARTGRAHLVELNPRCTMPCHLRLDNGRDLIGSLYSQLSGRTCDPPIAFDHDTVAYFPQARTPRPRGEVLHTDYLDVPWSEPDLIKELMLLPWPDRSLLARISDKYRNMTFSQRSAKQHVFHPAALGDTPGSLPGERFLAQADRHSLYEQYQRVQYD